MSTHIHKYLIIREKHKPANSTFPSIFHPIYVLSLGAARPAPIFVYNNSLVLYDTHVAFGRLMGCKTCGQHNDLRVETLVQAVT